MPPPQQELKLNRAPPNENLLCRFLSYLPKLQITLPYFKVVMSFLKKKTNNQDICCGSHVNMHMANKYLVVAKFTCS